MGAAALAAVALTASPAVNAQENGNRDENGRIVRGPYQTNAFGDNWFIGAGGGINVFLMDGYKTNIGPSIDAGFGKWFTPAVGMRIGYSGLNTNYWADQPSVLGSTLNNEEGRYQQKFGYMYIHGDFLWNASDAIGGYKETRFWNLVPYLHAGYFRAYGLDGVSYADNELAVGAGLLHNLRLAERLDLIVDMKAIVVNGRINGSEGPAFIPSVTMGLAVDLGWPGFVRTSTIVTAVEVANAEKEAILEAAALALEAANLSLAEENEELAEANDDLTKQLANLKKTEVDYSTFFEKMEPAIVYFEIGQAVLDDKEMQHLDFIAKNLIASADKNTKIYLTLLGTADDNTGTLRRNQHLSEARAKYIYDLLTTKYDISKERLIIKSEVVKNSPKPELSRAVSVSF
jgi:outer membrane protein OmpA-like peptidoglycan-associated protein